MRFVLPLPLNLANSRLHYMIKHRAKKRYWEALDMLQLTRQIPAPPSEPIQSVTIGHTWHVGNRMDPDNAYARLKFPLDWLRTRGYIIEDREENVTLSPPKQHIDRKSPRLELTITETKGAKP